MPDKRVFWLRNEGDTKTLGVLTYVASTQEYDLTISHEVEREELPVALRVLQRRVNAKELTDAERKDMAKAWVLSRVPAESCHTDEEAFAHLLMHSGRCPLDGIFMIEMTNRAGDTE